MLLAVGATGAKAQTLSTTSFGGTFTLSHAAQLGNVGLPAGEYSLYFGSPTNSGKSAVEVVGEAKGSPHAWIYIQSQNRSSAAKSALVCVREGDNLVVRSLEMADLGESVTFAMPHGTKLMAYRQSGSGNVQMAAAPTRIERIAVGPRAK